MGNTGPWGAPKDARIGRTYERPRRAANSRGLADTPLEVVDVAELTPMPPETREAIRILALTRCPDVDRSRAREQIEALAAKLEQRAISERAR